MKYKLQWYCPQSRGKKGFTHRGRDLVQYINEIERLTGNPVQGRENLIHIHAVPKFDLGNCSHVAWDITHIEEVNYADRIMSEIDSDYKYEVYIDTDDMDRYEGRREKTYWCYKISEACEELAKDILWATNYVMQGNDDVKHRVSNVVKDSVKPVEGEIREKAAKILALIKKTLKLSYLLS